MTEYGVGKKMCSKSKLWSLREDRSCFLKVCISISCNFCKEGVEIKDTLPTQPPPPPYTFLITEMLV